MLKSKKRKRARKVTSVPVAEAAQAKRPCLENEEKGLSTEDVEQSPPPTGRDSPLPATEQFPAATTGDCLEHTSRQTALRLSPPAVVTEEDSVAVGLKGSADEGHHTDRREEDRQTGGTGKWKEESNGGDDTGRRKRAQLVVGVNAVTRLLEHGALQVGLLCTSSPKLLCQHLMTLAATQKVPFATLPNLSEVVAKLLGIKRAMCMGLRKTSSDSAEPFQELVGVITSCAPPVTVPWLARTPTPTGGARAAHPGNKSAGSRTVEGKECGKTSAVYSPVHIKRIKCVPNSKNNRKKCK